MIARIGLSLFIVLALLPAAHGQKLYKWVDPDGRVSYHDKPPSEAGVRVEEKSVRFDGERASSGKGNDEAAANAPVVLYSAPKCSSCDAARAYLKERGVPFTEKNVDGDRKMQDELIKQAGGLAVPTIMVGAKVMRGYLESLLEGELDQAGYARPNTPAEQANAPAEQAATP